MMTTNKYEKYVKNLDDTKDLAYKFAQLIQEKKDVL